jgi:3-oxoacyl-[acyl-carrier-protein] synthase II
MKRRIMITGIGLVTPIGNTMAETWQSITAGRSGIAPLTRFDASAYSCRIGGELRGFDPHAFMSAKDARRTDPFIQYAVAAAMMALQDAGLPPGSLPEYRTGVLIGSGRGGVTTAEKNMALLLTKGPNAVSPFFTPMSLVNMASGYVAVMTGAKGPCLSVSTACATGTHSLGEAARMIQRGDADVMIAGGAEASLTPLVFAGFCQAKALSLRNEMPEKASRPFDLHRDGFVLSEGAGVLVLEELGHADARGAETVYAELKGYGLSADAFHYTRPEESGDGPHRAMSLALEDAGLAPEEIEYVNAHGTSTPANDRIETLALKKAFGNHAGNLAVSSSKSMLGHLLGAAGAVEAAITALALRHGIIPPTINIETRDPACDLDYVPNIARREKIQAALSNSLGFGGANAALVFTSMNALV